MARARHGLRVPPPGPRRRRAALRPPARRAGRRPAPIRRRRLGAALENHAVAGAQGQRARSGSPRRAGSRRSPAVRPAGSAPGAAPVRRRVACGAASCPAGRAAPPAAARRRAASPAWPRPATGASERRRQVRRLGLRQVAGVGGEDVVGRDVEERREPTQHVAAPSPSTTAERALGAPDGARQVDEIGVMAVACCPDVERGFDCFDLRGSSEGLLVRASRDLECVVWGRRADRVARHHLLDGAATGCPSRSRRRKAARCELGRRHLGVHAAAGHGLAVRHASLRASRPGAGEKGLGVVHPASARARRETAGDRGRRRRRRR